MKYKREIIGCLAKGRILPCQKIGNHSMVNPGVGAIPKGLEPEISGKSANVVKQKD